MRRLGLPVAVTGTILLAGCVAPPAGPTVLAMPQQGKSFDAFRADDASCRQIAAQDSGAAPPAPPPAAPPAAANQPPANPPPPPAPAAVPYNAQQLYDTSYAQCMAAHGNRVDTSPPGYAAGYPYPYPYGYPPYPYSSYGYWGPGVVIGGGYWGPRWHRW